MSRLRARSSCEIVRHPLPCNQLIHGCEQTPGADFATQAVTSRSTPAPPQATTEPSARPLFTGKERQVWHKAADVHSADLLQLPGLAVHSRQQEPGRLPHVIAVHREAAAVPRVSHRHPDPLHQRRQHDERPAGAHSTDISATAHEQVERGREQGGACVCICV